MKIALCLSGQPRYIDDGFSEINRNLLDRYDIDVFAHTWWDESYADKEIEFWQALSYNRKCKWDKDTIFKINNYYKPKKFIYEPQKEFNILNDVNYALQNPIAPYSMFYSIKKANDLKKQYENDHNFKYDIVMRCRFDIKFELGLNLNQIINNIIYVSGEQHYAGQFNLPNDQFAISSSDNMDFYSDLYTNMEYYKNIGCKDFFGEKLLKFHLLDYGKKNIKFCNQDELSCSIIIK